MSRPREYLSYSQYQIFLNSELNYINTYLLGIKKHNKYLEFGKMISYGLEETEEEACDDIILARQIIKKPIEREKEIFIYFHGIPLYGKLDGYNPGEIIEYKTSKKPWTQKMVDENEQLTFYTIMVNEIEKIPINEIKIKLIWLETFEDIDGQIHLTGRHKAFYTKRTSLDIVKIYPKIKRTWEGIEKLTNAYEKNISGTN